MRLRVLVFAGVREALGRPSLDVEVQDGARVDDLLAALRERHPQIARERLLVAVNQRYAPGDSTLRSGDEVALIPPVSGG